MVGMQGHPSLVERIDEHKLPALSRASAEFCSVYSRNSLQAAISECHGEEIREAGGTQEDRGGVAWPEHGLEASEDAVDGKFRNKRCAGLVHFVDLDASALAGLGHQLRCKATSIPLT